MIELYESLRFHGKPIFESLSLTKRVSETKTRSWKERWLSWPWKPWVKTRTIYYEVPSDEVLCTPQGFYMHPATAVKMRNMLINTPIS